MEKIHVPLGEDAAGILACPKCAGEFLHHSQVTIRNRQVEDAPGFSTTVTQEGVNRQPISTGFRGRRSDLEVTLECEDCEGVFRLVIMQYKGWTLLWTEAARPESSSNFDGR